MRAALALLALWGNQRMGISREGLCAPARRHPAPAASGRGALPSVTRRTVPRHPLLPGPSGY